MLRLCLIILLCLISPALASPSVEADNSAVRVMVYFTVGRDETPVSNVTVEQFKAHLAELAAGEYNVISLPDMAAAYKAGKPVPPQSVAITFDGGDRTVLENAVPLLEGYNFPYTVFIATSRADENDPRYLNWDDIAQMRKSPLVTFGLHPEIYGNLSYETDKNIRLNVNNATARFRDKISYTPTFFAYPFGEYSERYKTAIDTYRFDNVFGQQSGVAYNGSDAVVLPRFTMTENYADERRFKMTANALPLPHQDLTPAVSSISDTTPTIGFSVPQTLSEELSKLSCFASGQDKPELAILGNRAELRLNSPIDQTRFRINCTLPVETHDDTEIKHWRWFGLLFTTNETVLETEDGSDETEDQPSDGLTSNTSGT